MVIKLSGEQFGLKSNARFQNRTSSQRQLDLKSQVSRHTKIARHEDQLPLYYIFSGSQNSVAQIQIVAKVVLKKKKALKYVCLLWFNKAVSLAQEKIRSRAQNGAIRE